VTSVDAPAVLPSVPLWPGTAPGSEGWTHEETTLTHPATGTLAFGNAVGNWGSETTTRNKTRRLVSLGAVRVAPCIPGARRRG
jgi:hypothetical protein